MKRAFLISRDDFVALAGRAWDQSFYEVASAAPHPDKEREQGFAWGPSDARLFRELLSAFLAEYVAAAAAAGVRLDEIASTETWEAQP